MRVRGQRRNIIVIDYTPTATAMIAELRMSGALVVRAFRSVLDFHDAHFRWDPEDKTLRDVSASCQGTMLDAGQRTAPAAGDDDDETLDNAIKDVIPEG